MGRRRGIAKLPVPPPLDVVIAEALAQLGVDATALAGRQDRVHKALCDLWRANKLPPTRRQLADASGLRESDVRDALNQLRDAGRVRNVRRGVWVPLGVTP